MILEVINGKVYRVEVGECADCSIRGSKDYAGDCLAAQLCNGRSTKFCFKALSAYERDALRAALGLRSVD